MNKNSFTNLSYKAIRPSHGITPRKKYPLLTTHQTTNSYSKSLSNIFLNKSPSQSTIQAITLSPEPLYQNFEFKFSNLKRTLQKFQRTKSELVMHSYKQYDHYHHEVLHNNLRKNFSNFFLTSNALNEEQKTKTETTNTNYTILNDTAITQKRFMNVSTQSFLKDLKIPKILGDPIKKYPTSTHQDFSQRCLNQLKCGILFNAKKKCYNDMIEGNRNKVEQINSEYYSLLAGKKLMESFDKTYNNYLKFLHLTISTEIKNLDSLSETKTELEISNSTLMTRIDKLTKKRNKYASFKALIKKCCGTDDIDANTFFDKMNSIQNKIIMNIYEYEKKQDELKVLKQKLFQTTEIYRDNIEKEDILIKEEQAKLDKLKQRYETLTKSKESIISISKNSSLTRNILKCKNIKNLSIINSPKFNEIFAEMKFEKLLSDNPRLFTCISSLTSLIIENIMNNASQFIELKVSDSHLIITNEELQKILNKKYTNSNINEVRSNIIIMLKIIERSFEKIILTIDELKKTKKGKEIAESVKSKLENEKKMQGIVEQKKAIEKIREKILDNVVIKQKKIFVLSNRVYDDKKYFKDQVKKKNVKLLKLKEKNLFKSNSDENNELLQF